MDLGERGRLDVLDLVIMAAVSASALAFYLAFLSKSPLVYGVDGPYYLVQVRQIERTGTLKYGDPPLAFYVFYALSALLSNRVMGVKIGTALSAALAVLPAYCLLKLELKGRLPPALGSLALAFSPHLLRLSCDFLKNLMGSTFLLASLYFFARSLRTGSNRSLAASSVFLLLAGLTHSLAFAVNLALLTSYAALEALLGRSCASRALGKLALALVVPVSTALIGLMAFPRFFSDILKGEAFLEELLSGEPSPFLLLSPMTNLAFGLSCAGLVLGLKGARERESWASLVLASSLLGIALTLPLIPREWAWRFALMGFLPVSTAVASLARGTGDKLLSIALAIAVMTPLLAQTAVGAMVWGPRISKVEYSDLLAMSELVPPGSVVIAPNLAIGYWAEYLFDCDLARKPDPELFTRYQHVLLLLRADMRPPSIPKELLYEGEALVLFELFPRRPPGQV